MWFRLSENVRVAGMFAVLALVSIAFAYLTAEAPFSLSFVDRECQNAQGEYYRARDRALALKDQPPSEDDERHKDAHDHADVCAQYRMANAAEYGLVLLFGSLVFAGFAAVMAWHTVNTMRDTARREMRAYVGLFSGSITLLNLVEGGKGVKVQIELRNDGRTPGYDFTTWIMPPVVMDRGSVPFGPPRPLSDRTGKSTISPNTSAHISWTAPISDTEIAELNAGRRMIFAWGGADYTDAFGTRRHFIFRCQNSNAALLRAPGDVIAIQPHKAGYDAT